MKWERVSGRRVENAIINKVIRAVLTDKVTFEQGLKKVREWAMGTPEERAFQTERNTQSAILEAFLETAVAQWAELGKGKTVRRGEEMWWRAQLCGVSGAISRALASLQRNGVSLQSFKNFLFWNNIKLTDELQENYQELSSILHPDSPIVNILPHMPPFFTYVFETFESKLEIVFLFASNTSTGIFLRTRLVSYIMTVQLSKLGNLPWCNTISYVAYIHI